MLLSDRLERITTREELAEFIAHLHANYRAKPGSWENRDLDTYLEALAAYAHDIDGYFKNRGEFADDLPPWRLIAMMLVAATIYE